MNLNDDDLTDKDWDRFDELIDKLAELKSNKSDTDFQEEVDQALKNENEILKQQVKNYFCYSADPKMRFHGKTINDKYELREIIGEGAIGIVYKAKVLTGLLDHPVAVKMIYPGLASNSKLKMFIEEIRTYEQLGAGPFILPIKEADIYVDPKTKEKIPFSVMYLVVGHQPVTIYVKEKGLNESDRLEYFLQICEAIQYAHSVKNKDIFHGDLKPRQYYC